MKRVLVALVVVAALSACSGGSHPSARPLAPPTTNADKHPAASFTAAQLNAQAGSGVPRGWVPVDEGDARLWVPAKWTLLYGDSCLGGTANSTGVISIGPTALAQCQPASDLPDNAAALMASTQHDTGRFQTVHGYRVFAINSSKIDRTWSVYDVPQLRTRIAVRGTLATRILATLAPSSASVALAFVDAPVPVTLRPVTRQGVRLAIPPTWKIASSAPFCSLGPDSELFLGHLGGGAPSCGGPQLYPAVDAALSGAYLVTYPRSSGNTTFPGRKPILVLHHHTTTIQVFSEPEGYGAYGVDLFVHRAGSSLTHFMTVHFGHDGRVAAGVMTSIEARS